MPRHKQVAEHILQTISEELGEKHFAREVRLEDYAPSQEPGAGITVSPLGERELLGTNERDDIEYITLVMRVVHALGNDDLDNKSVFRSEIRRLFHNKRIELEDGCAVYCRVDFGEFAIPREFTSKNKSVSAMRVFSLVRESRI